MDRFNSKAVCWFTFILTLFRIVHRPFLHRTAGSNANLQTPTDLFLCLLASCYSSCGSLNKDKHRVPNQFRLCRTPSVRVLLAHIHWMQSF
ncbi:MAG: hypothetical protein E7572_05165 [Ruminococcaceae bacterium]|nr:hypothetical protein [Oscillospiraceae bacterium]